MKNQKKKSSNLPYVLIGLVLVGALVAVAVGTGMIGSPWSSKNTNANRAASNTRSTPTPVNAPPGAQPPNLLGSPTAAITLEEFADFQCASCAAAHPVMKEVQSIYGNRIKFIFRNYPLAIPAHDKAYDAAVAAEAAGMQGKFWAMQDQLFDNQQTWTGNPNYRQLFLDYATGIGLDANKFQNDIAGLAAKSRVDLDLARGRGMGVNSTPSIYLNGRPIPFSDANVATMRRLIDAEIQEAATKPAPAANTGTSAGGVNSAASNTK